ncbi:HRDC domain-containing protein [Flavobacterium sp. 3HN19-14]|uniref:HRDC domain-containing protein n=1 Tax=Flavobacterium sp. 3HN19-14 TaxID=3448133 RepID=UPI003EE0E637
MKIQLFTISIDAEQTVFDQNRLNDFLSTVAFKKSSVHFVESESAHWSVLVHYEEEEAIPVFRESTAVTAVEKELTREQQQTFSLLKQWRNNKSSDLNLPAYAIAHNSELMNAVLQNPESIQRLRKIKGFDDLKTLKYGEEIIAILQAQS